MPHHARSLVLSVLALAPLSAQLLGCATAPSPAAPAPTLTAIDPYLQSLVGEWDIERSIRGKVIGNRLSVAPVLSGKFIRLEMQSTSAADPYQAIVLVGFDEGRREYVAHWCDSFGPGYSALGRGTRDGQRLELRFEYPTGPFFNTWEFDPGPDRWTFVGESGSPSGQRKPFARDVITRRRTP